MGFLFLFYGYIDIIQSISIVSISIVGQDMVCFDGVFRMSYQDPRRKETTNIGRKQSKKW